MYLQKRTYSYYFRMPIPTKLRQAYGKSEICFSLNTLKRTEARLKSLEYIQKYILEFEQAKATPALQAEKKQEPAPIVSIPFSEVYEKYLKERKPAEGTLYEYKTVVNRFLAICGDRDIRLYVKSDIVKFKDLLIDYPRILKKEDLKLPPEKLIEKYKDTDYQRISVRTIREKYFALVSTIFSYAVNNDYRADNPVSSIKVVGKTQYEPSRLPYSVKQLGQLVQSEAIKNPQDEKYNEYKYIILLGIYTGARLEEICRLKNDDIGIEDGIHYIFIRPDLKSGHTLKTVSSRRRVPLHPRLLSHFGFEEYLNSVKFKTYVFPFLNTGNIVKGAVSHSFSKWFGRFLKTLGLGNKKLTFHSFRHTLKALGRTYNVEKSVLDCLQGHSEGSVSLSYGRDEYGSVYSLKTLYENLLKIDVFNVL